MPAPFRLLLIPVGLCLWGLIACGDDIVTSTEDTSPLPETEQPDAAQDDAPSDTTHDASDEADAPSVPLDWRPTAQDFGCLTDWTAVRGFYLTNLFGALDQAVAAAEAGFIDPVPPGTVIQLVPLEAMVKLAPGANPDTADWEFLLLDTGRGETTITARGGAEVTNGAGSCLGCHVGAADRDMVCEQTGLCNAAELSRVLIDALVTSDRRCR